MLHIVSITLLAITPLLINMKIASFFVALLVGALSDSAAAAAGGEYYEIKSVME